MGEKRFTHSGDHDTVAKKYEELALACLSGIRVFSFDRLDWGDDEICHLVEALPLCTNLMMLNLSHNKIGYNGLHRLLQHAFPNPVAINLSSNKLGRGSALLLAEEVEKLAKLAESQLEQLKTARSQANLPRTNTKASNQTSLSKEAVGGETPTTAAINAFRFNDGSQHGKLCNLDQLLLHDNEIPVDTFEDHILTAWARRLKALAMQKLYLSSGKRKNIDFQVEESNVQRMLAGDLDGMKKACRLYIPR